MPSADTSTPTACFTIATLARGRWHCRASVVRALIKSGALEAFRIDGRKGVRITPESVIRYEQAKSVKTPAAPKRRRVDGVIEFFK